VYSIDKVYANFYGCLAEGKYGDIYLKDRKKVIWISTQAIITEALRTSLLKYT